MKMIDKLHSDNPRREEFIKLIRYVYHRVYDERVTQVAGNITYTLILGIVPAIAVAFAIFTRFPQFETLREMLEVYFTRSMIPPGMAESILGYLTTFANKAAGVSIIGSIAMVFTTTMIFNLIETTFNDIWGVQEPRSLLRRALIYLFIAIFGPLLLGVSLYISSYFFLAARGIVGQLPYLSGIWPLLFVGSISTFAYTCLYRFVPYRMVRWKDAFIGGLFVAVMLDIAKRIFAIFVMQFASYQKIYGALAIIPMFLLWLYVSSLIILAGAVLVSSLPDFRSGRWRREVLPGSIFSDAIAIIRVLYYAQCMKNDSVNWASLQRLGNMSSAELESILIRLKDLGWIARGQYTRQLFKGRKPRSIRVALNEWKWTGDAAAISVADVYRAFVYQPEEDDLLSTTINDAIEEKVGKSLVGYFAELDRSDPIHVTAGYT